MYTTVISLVLIVIERSYGISSPLIPFTNYSYSISMQENISDLWWNINRAEQEILFEFHVKTIGWIAFGISPAGGMVGADIALSWVDQNGRVYIQDRYAFNNSRPVIDSSKADWILLQGREMNGWTAIQFKRKFDTCDPMDVSIQTGTNKLIYAYGLIDPDLSQLDNDITYHENRRGTRILSLLSYTENPTRSKYDGLDSIDFHVDNFTIPTTDTTYYCQVFRTPRNIISKRHAIAYEIIIDPNSVDLVHHLLLYECPSTSQFDDTILPKGPCHELSSEIMNCMMNAGTGWAVGGNTIIEYPEEAGYPFQTNFSVVYYLMQMHYSNPYSLSNRFDRSGIRFILGHSLRPYDIGYMTLGTNTDLVALAIPPQMKQFHVDSYCPSEATTSIPETGITVFAALPHTHLQGRSVWTKLFRNDSSMGFLHDAESYDFNHQIVHQFAKPITLYPRDTFYTRCIYNTMDKTMITLGGESTTEEMCLHFFAYYPRIPSFYTCISLIAPQAWATFAKNASLITSYSVFRRWLLQIQWNDTVSMEWQQFYQNATRLCVYGDSVNSHYKMLRLPDVSNIEIPSCILQTTTTSIRSLAIRISHPTIPHLFIIFSLRMTLLFNYKLIIK